ncbi:MAG: hypothetical protein M1826_006760 [Phylliscum demangeonii]|nr:MAG: hypothetical protein M1826_006760 [Phylliscum demangeonii]
MLPAAADECDESCLSKTLQRRFHLGSAPTLVFTSIPFALTFIVVGALVYYRLYPLLSGRPASRPEFITPAYARGRPGPPPWVTVRWLSAATFSATIALAAVLAELILCEISNGFDPAARALVLQLTMSSLLILLIIVTPLLQIHSVLASLGWQFTSSSSSSAVARGPGRFRMAWVLLAMGFAAWVAAFWWIGQGLPGTDLHAQGYRAGKSLNEACLERVGVIGISLMALLSGFASVSALWQNFGVKVRPVTEADLARKQAGLAATEELLATKRSRLRALDRKISDAPPEGFVSKVMGSIRGHGDVSERKAVQMEVAGLETMARSLASSLSILRHRRQGQRQASTATGRVLVLMSYGFAVYCLYRILATSFATLRRWWRPDATFSGTDPINHLLAVVAKHWDPSLDRLAWSRQISFLLSGLILLASFNSVRQTVHFFARVTPALVQQARANAGLLVSQISGTYVISSALLLRSNLPREVGSVISAALGAPLDSAFVDRWFESWFLAASGLTAVGILVARNVGASAAAGWDLDDDGDDDHTNDDTGDVERGEKRS